MAQKWRGKEVEKSKLILSTNWKEEMLLQKRLSALESLKRQRADSYTLDQRVLYNRFRTKLRRSELAHARLMGRRDVMEQLKSSAFSSFNTTVTDDSQTAVREILQGAARKITASARQRKPESSLTHSARPKTTPSHFQRSTKCSSGAGTVPKVTEGEVESQFPAVRPHTSTLFISPELQSGFFTQRPSTAVGTSLNYTVPLQSEGRGRTAGVKSVIFDANADECERFDTDTKGASQGPKSSGSSSWEQTVIKRESALNVFLNLGEQEARPSLLEIHASLIRHTRLEEKAKSFIEQVSSVRQCSTKGCDYYSERLLAMVTHRSRNPQLPCQLDKETAGWDVIGKELNYRSITFKKLDMEFCSKGCSF